MSDTAKLCRKYSTVTDRSRNIPCQAMECAQPTVEHAARNTIPRVHLTMIFMLSSLRNNLQVAAQRF